MKKKTLYVRGQLYSWMCVFVIIIGSPGVKKTGSDRDIKKKQGTRSRT